MSIQAANFFDPSDPNKKIFSVKENKLVEPGFFKRVWYWLQDIWNKDIKWIRLANNIDIYSRNILENSKTIDSEAYKNVEEISKVAAEALNKSRENSIKKGKKVGKAVHSAIGVIERQNIARNFRLSEKAAAPIAPQHASADLKNKIIEELKKPANIWAADFHALEEIAPITIGPLDTIENSWFEKKWEQIAPIVGATPHLEQLLMEHPNYLEDFIVWCFKDNCPAEVFIGFPEITDRLKPHYVAERLGRASENREKHLLNVIKNNGECYVTLPIETTPNSVKEVPILSREKFPLCNGIETDLKGFAKQLVDRYDDIIPHFQCTQKGLLAHNVHLIGSPLFDEESEEIGYQAWWENFPVYEKISVAEASRRCKGLNGKIPGFVMHSTMETVSISITGNHGYFELLLPAGDGEYNVYSFGKSAKKSPDGFFSLLSFLANTVPAVVCAGPDQNEEFANRQNWGIGFELREEDTERVKKIVFDAVQSAVKNNVPYSLLAKNCHSFQASIMKNILLELVPQEQQAELKKKIHALYYMDLNDRKHLPEFDSFFLNALLKGVRRNNGLWKGVLSLMRGGRSLKCIKNGQPKKYSVTAAKCVTKCEFPSPHKTRMIALDHLARPDHTPLIINKERNRIYIANGMDFLRDVETT